uniref:Uncharacterized protein n=1 Tax=Daphnia galeata TaxID=27404 RepID=A0A8J2S439_9CRUS|nr:unnamed protein product [Daphnia galeata]
MGGGIDWKNLRTPARWKNCSISGRQSIRLDAVICFAEQQVYLRCLLTILNYVVPPENRAWKDIYTNMITCVFLVPAIASPAVKNNQ